MFDRVLENAKKFAASRQSFSNIANISTNEVLARSLNTTLASALPVVSLLVVGSFIMGAKSLEDFAVALLVGMIAGTYSSIFVAVPLLDVLKQNEPKYKPLKGQIAVGAAMSELMGHGDIKRLAVTKSSKSSSSATTETSLVTNEELIAQAEQRATSLLTHPPRPSKKRR